MNVELYKLLDSANITNYDQSDMGEPRTLYIPPIEVSKNGPGRLWATRPISTFGGGPHRQSGKARYANSIERPNGASHPPSSERQDWQNTIFYNWLRSPDVNSNGAQSESESTRQGERNNRSARDENVRLETPTITSSANVPAPHRILINENGRVDFSSLLSRSTSN